jgi:phosphoribosylaminoimidazole (AIR) synthetase
LKKLGNVPDDDYRRTFNLGVGMVLIVPQKKLKFVSKLLKSQNEPFYEVGRVVPQKRKQDRVLYL